MEFNGRHWFCDTPVSSACAKAVGHLPSPDQELEPSISVFGAESTTNKFWPLCHVFIRRGILIEHGMPFCTAGVQSLAWRGSAGPKTCFAATMVSVMPVTKLMSFELLMHDGRGNASSTPVSQGASVPARHLGVCTGCY